MLRSLRSFGRTVKSNRGSCRFYWIHCPGSFDFSLSPLRLRMEGVDNHYLLITTNDPGKRVLASFK